MSSVCIYMHYVVCRVSDASSQVLGDFQHKQALAGTVTLRRSGRARVKATICGRSGKRTSWKTSINTLVIDVQVRSVTAAGDGDVL